MVSKRKMATAAVATFGAAISTVYTAPELQADIVDLTFTPSSVAFGITGTPVGIDQAGATFRAWNTSVTPGVTNVGGLAALNLVSSSQTLVGGTLSDGGINGLASGSNFLGFETLGGNVGWFQANWSAGGSIDFVAGEFGNAGEAVHVGGTAIPEPTTFAGLGLLALGAAGVRRNRKK